jgi:predicted tellurium resistance membrane protein TerC
MEWIPSLLTLTVLEVVLGIDNVVMIAVIAGGLPERDRERARVAGLALALVTRLLLLAFVGWLAGLVEPLIAVAGQEFSGRDLIMLLGGGFLIWKSVHEMHQAVEEAGSAEARRLAGSFAGAVGQIVVLDIVFSLDSVITAVGMARAYWVMAAAIVITVALMAVASGPIIRFIQAHPTLKMLALAFVLLVGVTLVADGWGLDIPRGYIYAAMAFSLFVESLNIVIARRRQRLHAARGNLPPH